MENNHVNVRKIVGTGLLAAIIVVLQFVGASIKLGPFSISTVLMPIVVGAALFGAGSGAVLGAVFGLVVLLSGDAAPFMVISPIGTVFTVMVKGALAGLCAGLVYRALEKKNDYVAALCAAVTAPVVNTGVFLIGCVLFFLDTITAWGEAAGFKNVGAYMFLGLAGVNFLTELAINVVLCPVIVRLIRMIRKD